MRFAEIKGLDEIKNSLQYATENNHVAHAYLMHGRPGSATLTMAQAFAMYINCESPVDGDACGQCASCRKMSKGIHPDQHFVYPVFSTSGAGKDKQRAAIQEEWRKFIQQNPYASLPQWAAQIEAENKQCAIAVEESRNIVKAVSLKAFEAKYKMVYIWLPEKMNASAANALLKVLEEPPDSTVFLLISQDIENIMTTITSRCQIVHIRPFTPDELTDMLINQYEVESQVAQEVAVQAEGSLFDALQFSEAGTFDEKDLFREWMRLCYANKFSELAFKAEDFQKKSREEQKGLLRYGINVMRELLIFHAGSHALMRMGEEQQQFLKGFGKVVKEHHLEQLFILLQDAIYHIERNASPKITFMNLSIAISRTMKL